MPRSYTSKTRAKSITLNYFQDSHPFRNWKRALSIIAPAIGGVWIVLAAISGNEAIYNSGSVSTAHTMFESRCMECHVTGGGAAGQSTAGWGYWKQVTDAGCEKCHAGPLHQGSQTFTPACDGCHSEHDGRVILADMHDGHCTQCHAELPAHMKTTPTVASQIPSFVADHPEFAVAVRSSGQSRRIRLNDSENLTDAAQMKLNHKKHLKPGLQGIKEIHAANGMAGLRQSADGLQLNCSYCHQADAQLAYMAPIDFMAHCRSCHPLDFDPRLPEATAPHQEPLRVRAYLLQVFTEAFQECEPLVKTVGGDVTKVGKDVRQRCQQLGLVVGSAEEKEQPRGRRRRSVRRRRSAPQEEEAARSPRRSRRGRRSVRRRGTQAEAPAGPPTAAQWIPTQIANSERLIYKQKCEFCHMLSREANQLPKVAPTAIPTRWLPNSTFNHGIHRPLACTECHQARQSQKTTAVLLPSISHCRKCHSPSGGARAGCVECHLYHDKTKERDLNGPLSVPQLVQSASPPATLAIARSAD